MRKYTIIALSSMLLISSLSANPICTDSIDRFTIDTDKNTVTDNKTGLVWQRCGLGQTGGDCTGTPKGYIWEAAVKEVSKNHNGWRLPNVKELLSIIDEQCSNPATNTYAFPNTQDFLYWSSTEEEWGDKNDNARSVDFSDGTNYYSNKRGTYYVRLVRDK